MKRIIGLFLCLSIVCSLSFNCLAFSFSDIIGKVMGIKDGKSKIEEALDIEGVVRQAEEEMKQAKENLNKTVSTIEEDEAEEKNKEIKKEKTQVKETDNKSNKKIKLKKVKKEEDIDKSIPIIEENKTEETEENTTKKENDKIDNKKKQELSIKATDDTTIDDVIQYLYSISLPGYKDTARILSFELPSKGLKYETTEYNRFTEDEYKERLKNNTPREYDKKAYTDLQDIRESKYIKDGYNFYLSKKPVEKKRDKHGNNITKINKKDFTEFEDTGKILKFEIVGNQGKNVYMNPIMTAKESLIRLQTLYKFLNTDDNVLYASYMDKYYLNENNEYKSIYIDDSDVHFSSDKALNLYKQLKKINSDINLEYGEEEFASGNLKKLLDRGDNKSFHLSINFSITDPYIRISPTEDELTKNPETYLLNKIKEEQVFTKYNDKTLSIEDVITFIKDYKDDKSVVFGLECLGNGYKYNREKEVFPDWKIATDFSRMGQEIKYVIDKKKDIDKQIYNYLQLSFYGGTTGIAWVNIKDMEKTNYKKSIDNYKADIGEDILNTVKSMRVSIDKEDNNKYIAFEFFGNTFRNTPTISYSR